MVLVQNIREMIHTHNALRFWVKMWHFLLSWSCSINPILLPRFPRFPIKWYWSPLVRLGGGVGVESWYWRWEIALEGEFFGFQVWVINSHIVYEWVKCWRKILRTLSFSSIEYIRDVIHIYDVLRFRYGDVVSTLLWFWSI